MIVLSSPSWFQPYPKRNLSKEGCFAFFVTRSLSVRLLLYESENIHPKTLIEIAMVLSKNSGSIPPNSHVSATFSILLKFGEFWNPTNCEKFNVDGSLMGRMNVDKSVW